MNRLVAVLVPILAGVIARGAFAQGLASPRGSVMQIVDSATVTVEYYRPSMRGRTIFGRLVHWGELWTPGANWATTLEIDRDIRIEEQLLPRGKYSMWMIPRPDSWTVVLSRAWHRFHVMRPDPGDEQLRFTVHPDSVPPLEMLTFSFPEVSRSSATLRFQWAGTVIPIHLQSESKRLTLAANPWRSYAGQYDVYRVRRDGASPTAIPFEVIASDTGLHVRTTSDLVEPGLDTEFDLLPAGGDGFHPRQYQNGKIVGVELDELIVFHVDGDRATSFEVRAIAEQRVLARATRRR